MRDSTYCGWWTGFHNKLPERLPYYIARMPKRHYVPKDFCIGVEKDPDGRSLKKTIKKELDRVLKKNGFGDEGAKPKTPPKPKKKKLRIKLSLKAIKTHEEGSESKQGGEPPQPVKKKRKKNKQDSS